MKPATEIPLEWIREQLAHTLNAGDVENLLNSLKTVSPVSFRLNPHKFSEILSLDRVPWCNHGYYLPERPSFTHDPLFHTGAYYVQEASSMFVGFIFENFLDNYKKKNDLVALDVCAAPGGKTALLAAVMADKGVVVANEVVKKRFHILEENCIKWGTGNIIPVSVKVSELTCLNQYVDFVLVDAPCSGEGLWRKSPEAVEEWSAENVEMCALRQKEILHDAWKNVKPGGWMVYSTCTFNIKENEGTVDWFSKNVSDAQPVELKIPTGWNIHAGEINGFSCFRFFPGKIKGEGFFAVVFQKKDNVDVEPVKHSSFVLKKIDEPEKNIFKEKKTWWKDKNNAFHASSESVFRVLNDLKTIPFTSQIFETKRADESYSSSLAWRVDLNPDFFPVLELDPDEAIKFLMCDTSGFKLTIPERITHLATYKGLGLGFIRKIGNSVRIDYPKNWRILKQGKAKPVF